MFVIHGTYTPQKKRGLAADVCPRCAEVRRFLVTDHYQVAHLYFIPLGSGTYQGSSQECQQCRLRVLSRPSIFDRILSPKEAADLSEEQFLVATNPGLALPEPQRTQWVEAVSDLTLFGGDGAKSETLPDLALKRLAKANLPTDRLHSFSERFKNWEDATLMQRLALLTEAAATVGGGQELRSAYYFAQTAMQAAPNGAGCLLAIPLGGLLGAAWLGLLIALIDAGFDVAVVVTLCLMAVTTGILLLEACARRAYRSWFLKHVIVPAEQQEIDLALVLHVFRETKPTPQTPDNVKALLGKAKILERLIQERNPLAVA